MSKGIEEYMGIITKKIEMPKKDPSIKLKKIQDDEIVIPTRENIELLHQFNYNGKQLKSFAKHYKIKQSGNKNEIFQRIYFYLKLSKTITIIQKIFRGYIQRSYDECHGPAYRNRALCVNDTDFLTMDNMKDIPPNQFFSFKDSDDFVYGFDMLSLFNLKKKMFFHRETKNPYNRNLIPKEVILNMKKMIRLSRILRCPINIQIDDDQQGESDKDALTRCRELFNAIDGMGHYTSPEWFMSLDLRKLRRLVRELTEIWNYRANIPLHVRRQICPPNGDPFRELRYADLFTMEDESVRDEQRKMVLRVLEKLVYSGTNDGNKSLGAYYVLGSLTLVNRHAASSMPWLYESFVYV